MARSFNLLCYQRMVATVEVLFPVVNNQTIPGAIDDDGGLTGAVGDALPGFGLMAGMAALAMAAVAGSRVKKRRMIFLFFSP